MIRVGNGDTSIEVTLQVSCDWPLVADVDIVGRDSAGKIVLTLEFMNYVDAIMFATDILNAAKECKRRVDEYDEYMKTQTGIDGMNRAEAE